MAGRDATSTPTLGTNSTNSPGSGVEVLQQTANAVVSGANAAATPTGAGAGDHSSSDGDRDGDATATTTAITTITVTATTAGDRGSGVAR